MKTIYTSIIVLVVIFATGCSIKHPIAEDYPQYLNNNIGQAKLPKTDIVAEYSMSEPTVSHRYEFRAVTVGYAHLWIVEFGDILDATLKSDDVQSAFGKLSAKTEGEDSDYLLSFNLENYEFKDMHAFVTLNIALIRKGQQVFDNTYSAEGKSQGAKMFWGGPFAMRNATQQSTKLALDEIMTNFINDINRAVSPENL